MTARALGLARRFAAAAAVLGAALLLGGLTAPWLQGNVRLTPLFAAVAVAARYAGLGPAGAVALFGYVAVGYLAFEPHAGWLPPTLGPEGLLGFASYAATSAIIIALGESLRRTQGRAAAAASALRASEERFRIALESSATAFAILHAVRAQDGRIIDFRWVYVNSEAERVIGRPAAELIGQRVAELFAWSWEVPGLFSAYCRAIETGEPQTVESVYSPHGTPVWFHNIATAFGDGIAVWFADVTASRSAELAAREARTQLQTVTELMAAGTTRCSRDLRYVWVNRQFAEWIDRPAEEVVGRSIEEVLGEATFRRLLPHFRTVLAGERVEHELQIEFARLGPRWVNAVYVPAFASDGVVDGWVAVVTDITNHKRLELALLEADRRKDEFLAVLAHELRNPLAPMRNALELLRMKADPDVQLQHPREIIDRQLHHLSRLVDDLLDLSRVTQGRIQLRCSRVPIAVVIAHAVETSAPLIIGAGHELDVRVPQDPLYVQADVTRLAQIISNLLNNAAKYTPRGGRITLSAVLEAQEICVEVADTGIGIASDMLPRIFDMFVQADRSLEHTQDGLGIGLTLVSRLVHMHGGTVEASSEGPGRGSRFRVRLPLAPHETVDVGLPARPAPASAPRRRVLIVDDNVDAAESLAMLLAALGHETHLAHDGEQALAAVAAFGPDVVMLDIGLPRLNGYEVARRIRGEGRHGHGPQLIALTGWGQDEDRRRAKEAGFDLHLTKPVDLEVLHAIMARSPAELVDQMS